MPTDWTKKVSDHIEGMSQKSKEMGKANAEMVQRVMSGLGPDKTDRDPTLGGRVAVNIPSVHVPSFCGDKYKNTYDLGKTSTLGEIPPNETIPIRTFVDEILAKLTKSKARDIYFGALELNGTGVRFYGDFTLILKEQTADTLFVFSTNSYDLVRPPLTVTDQAAIAKIDALAEDRFGKWEDATQMAVLKTFNARPGMERRLTTGQISEAVLEDEDYIETLRIGTFEVRDVQEARVSAADTAVDIKIGEQLRLGLCPSMGELQWRKHRRAAVRALQNSEIRTRVVTTAGRIRA